MVAGFYRYLTTVHTLSSPSINSHQFVCAWGCIGVPDKKIALALTGRGLAGTQAHGVPACTAHTLSLMAMLVVVIGLGCSSGKL